VQFDTTVAFDQLDPLAGEEGHADVLNEPVHPGAAAKPTAFPDCPGHGPCAIAGIAVSASPMAASSIGINLVCTLIAEIKRAGVKCRISRAINGSSKRFYR
jgi:hypothetical protein